MTDLNSEIIAYLSVNNIPYTAGDYQTGQPEGQAQGAQPATIPTTLPTAPFPVGT